MKYIITHHQSRLLLESENFESINSKLKYLNSFFKKISKKSTSDFGIDLKLLSTWGTAIGGLVAPLDNFIRTNNFDVTDEQINLILIGCILTLFYGTENSMKKFYEQIKNQNLEEIYTQTLKKGTELRSSFIDLLKSLNVSSKSVISLIRYSFLIPIINDLILISQDNSDIENLSLQITKRLMASAVLSVSFESLHEVVKRLLEKLR